jgi:predicted nucleic acid-binding protein
MSSLRSHGRRSETLYRDQGLDAIQPACDPILRFLDEVIAIDRTGVEKAKQIVVAYRRLSARGSLHLAIIEQRGISRILSFDLVSTAIPGVARIF